MSKIKNWTLTKDWSSRKYYRNDDYGVVLQIKGRNGRGDTVDFRGAEYIVVDVTSDQPISKKALREPFKEDRGNGWTNDTYEDISKPFDTKSEAEDWARNWMAKNTNPSQYRMRSNLEQKKIREIRGQA